MIELSESGTRLLFALLVVFGPLILQLSRYCKTNIGRDILIALSYIFVLIPLGFRANGIDNENYRIWYLYPQTIIPYRWNPEPLFALLTLSAHFLFHSFQLVYLVPAIIFLSGVYKFVISKCDDYFSSFIFIMMSLYVYMCGLVRYAAALGLLFWAMSDFKKKKRFFILVLLAGLFHYAAFFGFVIYVFYATKRKFSLKNIIIFFVLVLGATYIIAKYSASVPFIQRYQDYITPSFDAGVFKLYIIVLPALLFYLFYYKWIQYYTPDGDGVRNIIILLLMVMCVSTFLEGTYRICWMMYGIVAYIYSLVPRAIVSGTSDTGSVTLFILIYKMGMCVLAVFYVLYVLLRSIYIAPSLIPFRIF